MLHDLPRRLFDHPLGRRLILLFSLGFVLAHLGFATVPFLPGNDRMRMMWPMFIGSAKSNKWLSFEGVTQAGDVVPVDATRFLHFTRGFTQQRIIDVHHGLWKDTPQHQRHQRVFARWLARQVWLADGIALSEVRFRRHKQRIRTGELRDGTPHSVPITADDLERDIPREAGRSTR